MKRLYTSALPASRLAGAAPRSLAARVHFSPNSRLAHGTKNTMTPFPDDWPPGYPPADAQMASGLIYRLVRSNSTAANDFLTHAELGKMPKAPPCLRVGLSVFRTRDDVVHQADLFPFLGNRIASGELCPEHGKTKLTPGKMPSHTTWWPYSGVDRAAVFAIVEVIR